ncbi:MAG: hypothetical protein HKN79_05495 [Flavobacteriales bacterium]|nr:hypothetical protein [Flavobacteriales bacterium]
MKRTATILLLFVLLASTSMHAEAIVIDGFYQGKDLYVKNPTGPKGVGFCVYEVQVNGEITSDEINSSAFIIDLHILGLDIGDPVTVQIIHHDDCRPKVLNADAVLPQSTYEVTSMKVDDSGVLHWETRNEMGELPYKIQQFKWNKWVTVGEVQGTGRMENNRYAFQLDAHSGRNIYRIAQRSNKGKGRYSEEIVYQASGQSPVTITSSKINNSIAFSGSTHYEIFDEYGRLVKRGYSKEVNVAALDKGRYYINYDNRFGESFTKR